MSRVAVVTGGTRGIGEEVAKALKGAGYKVAATYVGNDERAKAFSDATGIHTFKFDAGKFEDVQAGMAAIEADVGPVDILVNNAGITRDAMLHKQTYDNWDAVIQADLSSCFNTCKAVIAGMRERGFGRIINMSSINAQKGQMGQTNYSAAKAGMIGFSKALAQENAFKGITVNAVCPGYINTEMVAAVPEEVLKKIIAGIPVGRLGEPEDIARAVLFLVADEASFITGATLSVNGGQLME